MSENPESNRRRQLNLFDNSVELALIYRVHLDIEKRQQGNAKVRK